MARELVPRAPPAPADICVRVARTSLRSSRYSAYSQASTLNACPLTWANHGFGFFGVPMSRLGSAQNPPGIFAGESGLGCPLMRAIRGAPPEATWSRPRDALAACAAFAMLGG